MLQGLPVTFSPRGFNRIYQVRTIALFPEVFAVSRISEGIGGFEAGLDDPRRSFAFNPHTGHVVLHVMFIIGA